MDNPQRPMAFVTYPGVIAFRNVPVPELKKTEVKIRVRAVTLCGSDIHIFKGKHPSAALPVPVGHEIAGDVVETGEEVSQLKVGDRVAVEPVLVCGSCHFCLRGAYHLCQNISFQYRKGQGGLTPFFVADERWLHKIPDEMTYLEGALLEPLAVTVHAARRVRLEPGDGAAVFGDGPIGLLVLQVLRAMGAGHIYLSGIRQNRLELALAFGANAAIDSMIENPVEAILKLTGGLGVALSFEAVGLDITLRQALDVVRKGGASVLVGLFEEPHTKLNPNLLVQRELSLVGAQGYSWDFQRAIELVQQKKVDLASLVTHQFNLEDSQKAFDLLVQPGSPVVKAAVVIP